MTKDPDKYLTIEKSSEGLFKDRGSKFIAYLHPCQSPTHFSESLEKVKSLHFKARHHCFAYKLIDENQFRYSDDGEPGGTAGKPIYNQLLSSGIVNASCIVVRYFGGTKLGTSGLINAYKEAAKDAIANNVIITKYHEEIIDISFDYAVMGQLMNELKYLNINIRDKTLDANPVINIGIRRSEVEHTINKIKARLLNRPVEDISPDTKVDGVSFLIREKPMPDQIDFGT
ncbi:MAG: YigZ family protein [Saprospiraceae bacterium]|nr:YigZ family protein [Saprospiraceae bacterium]